MNNISLRTADGTTHLKIVALALVASIVVLVVGITAHTTSFDTARIQASGPAVKAGKPIAVTHGDTTVIR
jgi:hypothetical protein